MIYPQMFHYSTYMIKLTIFDSIVNVERCNINIGTIHGFIEQFSFDDMFAIALVNPKIDDNCYRDVYVIDINESRVRKICFPAAVHRQIVDVSVNRGTGEPRLTVGTYPEDKVYSIEPRSGQVETWLTATH